MGLRQAVMNVGDPLRKSHRNLRAYLIEQLPTLPPVGASLRSSKVTPCDSLPLYVACLSMIPMASGGASQCYQVTQGGTQEVIQID